jgi:hypothetical protein
MAGLTPPDARPRSASSLFQEVGKRFGVADKRIACEAQCFDRSLGGGLVAGTAGISDNHRNEAQVRGVASGRLDANFCCDTRDGDGHDSTIAQGDRKRRSFEGRHGDLVEHSFVWSRSEFGDDLKAGRVAQELRRHAVRLVLPLPSHRRPVLHRPHPRFGQREMPCEGYPHSPRPRDCQQTADPRDNLTSRLDLAADADLHVIDEQCHALRIACVLKCSGYGQTMSVFHSPFLAAKSGSNLRNSPTHRRFCMFAGHGRVTH